MSYVPTIGLEIHAELKTKSKMFCGSPNAPDEQRPNTNVCPICLGYPGTLPVINEQAVRHILLIGLAVKGSLAEYTQFDRKSYFYPDIPKGYQISQYKYPLVRGGRIGDVAIHRIHLEEDTGQSQHGRGGVSTINYNRAGVPLMELVTEPTIEDAQQAISFARDLQLLLRYLEVGDANMEKGEMRVEANISVAEEEAAKLGTKVELKNLNSFRAVEKSIAYEIDRQERLLVAGEQVVQETRGWDEDREITYTQRRKEESHDYRYFPDPDLTKMQISLSADLQTKKLTRALPELPWQRRERYSEAAYIGSDSASVLTSNRILGDFYDAVCARFGDSGDERLKKLTVNYLTSDVQSIIQESDVQRQSFLQRNPSEFAELMRMVGNDELSSRGAKNILPIWIETGREPRDLASELNLLQQSDEDALDAIAQQVIHDHPEAVQEFKAGKQASLQYLIGQGMRFSKGSANPKILAKVLKSVIESD